MSMLADIAAPQSAHEAESLALELFVAGYVGKELPDTYRDRLERGLSGVILFKRNLVHDADGAIDVVALTAHTRSVQAHSPGPLAAICAVDQEGGLVARLRRPFLHLPPMAKVAERGERLCNLAGAQTGRECLAAGFNVDFAPILDVDTNPNNPIIGERAFGKDPETVTRLAGAFLRGLQGTGVLGCGKHFPGHGDTDTDSHLALPVLSYGMDRLEKIELAPFAALADELPMVMTAHILYRQLDDRFPATLSPTILRPLLRERCGFGGVIVSDDLEMKGVADAFSYRQSVRLGLAAGVDLFLVCKEEDALNESVDEAAKILLDGGDESARALDAIVRVRRLRASMARPSPSLDTVQRAFGHSDRETLRNELGLEGV